MNLTYLFIISEVLILLGLIGTLITSIKLIKILRKNEKDNLEIIKELIKQNTKNKEDSNE